MQKKLTKILLILLTIFVVYFIKMDSVRSETLCNYIYPFTYINETGDKSYGVDVRLNIDASTNEIFINAISNERIDGLLVSFLEVRDSDSDKTSIKANLGYYKYNMALSEMNTYYDPGLVSPSIDMSNGCPEYIKLTTNRSKETITFTNSSKNEYFGSIKYQYNGLKLPSGKMYITHQMVKSDKQAYLDSCTKTEENAIKNIYGHVSGCFNIHHYNFLHKVGVLNAEVERTVVLRRLADGDPYSTARLDSFNSNVAYAKKCDGDETTCKNHANYRLLTDEEKTAAKDGLARIIDTNATNTRTYDSAVYDATVSKMKKYINQVKNRTTDITITEKTLFQKWFYVNGRYLFEDDIVQFRDIFEFLFRQGIVKFSNNDVNQAIGSQDQKQYNLLQAVFDAMVGVKYVSDIQEEIANDRCLPVCESCINYSYLLEDCKKTCNKNNLNNEEKEKECVADKCTKFAENNTKYDSNTCIQCKKSTAYQSCRNCLYNEENVQHCNTVVQNAYNTLKSFEHLNEVRESCVKTCMGEDVYNKYNTSYEKVTSELSSYKDDFISQITDNLIKYEKYTLALARVSDPALDIDFNDNGYIANCEDVKVFHIIYRFMIYLAPILVIVLGSIDYFRAMLSGKEDEQLKFKKQFKRRIISLILLIIVPIVISLILNLYNSATNGSLDSNLMYCVVNGDK